MRRFNATLSAKGYVWFWPKIAAALTSKHHWLIIACDSCNTVVDLDLRVKPRTRKPPSVSRCVMCNVRVAMGTVDHAPLRWRDMRRFEKQTRTASATGKTRGRPNLPPSDLDRCTRADDENFFSDFKRRATDNLRSFARLEWAQHQRGLLNPTNQYQAKQCDIVG